MDLPSRMKGNPTAWMIEINGFAVDARHLKREYQEFPLRKGLIPYIPERGSPRVPAQGDGERYVRDVWGEGHE